MKRQLSAPIFEKRLEKAFHQYLINKQKSQKERKIHEKTEKIMMKEELRKMKIHHASEKELEWKEKMEPIEMKNELEKMNKFLKIEKRFYSKKLELSKKIFGWKDTLQSMKVGRRIINDLVPYKGLGFGIPIYHGKYGHKRYESEMKNSGGDLRITNNSIIYRCYIFGRYKIFPIELNFKTPRKMAKQLRYDFLSETWKSIDSGITSRWLIKIVRGCGKW